MESIVPEMPVYENIAMSNYERVKKNGLISSKESMKQADAYVKELEIKLPNVRQKVGRLSGGNAQKVVFARVLASGADILMLDHPTRGVDVGAKSGNLFHHPLTCCGRQEHHRARRYAG